MSDMTDPNTISLVNLREQILDLVDQYWKLKSSSEVTFSVEKPLVPPSGKLLNQNEVKNMVDASLDAWLTTGRFNSLFEQKLKEFLGVNYVHTCNSGSSANLIAISALFSPLLGDKRILPGDEIITCGSGFPTTVNPIIQNGAVPVFVDASLPSYNIDISYLDDALSSKTKAIVVAHTLGNPFDLDKISDFCRRHNLWLVEDCCDALGSTYNGQKVGTFGDISTLSFYPAHHITTGEGGAVFTKKRLISRICESLRDWGRDCYCPPGVDNTCHKRFDWNAIDMGGALPDGYDHKYIYSHVGYNLKLTDMQAACGVAQIDKLDSFISQRKANFSYLKEHLSIIPDLILPQAQPSSDPSWFGFPISLSLTSKHDRSSLVKYLDSRGIGTRLLFAGNITKQPYFMGLKYRKIGNLDNCDFIMSNTFWIGVQPALTHQHLEYVVKAFHEYFFN